MLYPLVMLDVTSKMLASFHAGTWFTWVRCEVGARETDPRCGARLSSGLQGDSCWQHVVKREAKLFKLKRVAWDYLIMHVYHLDWLFRVVTDCWRSRTHFKKPLRTLTHSFLHLLFSFGGSENRRTCWCKQQARTNGSSTDIEIVWESNFFL